MLEIIVLWLTGKKIAGIASDKGLPGFLFVIMLVVLWFGGEIVGAVIGVATNHGEVGATAYLFALMGAGMGALASFIIVSAIPAPRDEREDEEFDLDGR